MSKTTRRDVLKGGAMAGLAGLAGCKSGKHSTPAVNSTTSHKVQAHWERPPKQTGNNLNVIVLVSDTYRADNLEAYGSQWVDTPNLNQFAKESIVFESFYPEGMPTCQFAASFIRVGVSSRPISTFSKTRSNYQGGISYSWRMSRCPRRCRLQIIKPR